MHIEDYGFRLTSRDNFLDGEIEMCGLEGCLHMSSQDIDRCHARHLAALRARARQYPGAWVIYDPSADDEGWLLVGDDVEGMKAQTLDAVVLPSEGAF